MENLEWTCFKSNGYILDSLRNGEAINETDYFAVKFQSSNQLPVNDLVVLITDYPFELKERYVSGKYIYVLSEDSLKRYFREEGFEFKDYEKEIEALKMSKLFVNYPMGISEIQLYDNKREAIISEFKVNITSDKLNEREFLSLVDYVESKSVALWAKYSLLKNEALPNDLFDKNDWQLLFLQKFIEEVNAKIHLFSFDKFISYKKEAQIALYHADVLVDDDSIYWLAQNLDTISSTISSDYDKVLIQNRLFKPSEILTNNTYESTDILENRFVHGFIDTLISFIELIKTGWLDNTLIADSNNFQEILYYYSQKRKLKLFEIILVELKNIKLYLSNYIPVTETILDYIPTHKIDSKDHYQFLYIKFIEWFSHDKVKFSNNKIYFKGVTRMDKLFERACLFKLIDIFIELDYNAEITEKKEGIPQIIHFNNKKNGQFHSLFYECYPNKISTLINTKGPLKPDFYIEFDNGTILILDSKYKKSDNVKKFDWDKLSLKYLHGLGYTDGGHFTPLGLFALIPAYNNQTKFYQNKKYDLDSQTPAYPSIGNIIVDFEENSQDLTKYIKRIINLIY